MNHTTTNNHHSVVVENDDYTFVTLSNGTKLQGEELEEYCKRKGLCPLCAKTKIRTKTYKLFSKRKWEPLTILDETMTNKKKGNNTLSIRDFVYVRIVLHSIKPYD